MKKAKNAIPPKSVTTLGEMILEILQSDSGWKTRNEIAEGLNRKRLIPYDLAQLEYLASIGRIEVREATRGIVGKRLEYRIRQG
jgi:hypothetical protein